MNYFRYEVSSSNQAIKSLNELLINRLYMSSAVVEEIYVVLQRLNNKRNELVDGCLDDVLLQLYATNQDQSKYFVKYLFSLPAPKGSDIDYFKKLRSYLKGPIYTSCWPMTSKVTEVYFLTDDPNCNPTSIYDATYAIAQCWKR